MRELAQKDQSVTGKPELFKGMMNGGWCQLLQDKASYSFLFFCSSSLFLLVSIGYDYLVYSFMFYANKPAVFLIM